MDGAVREVLAKCLPDTEPAFQLRVEEVIRRGRWRRRVRTATPVSAAALVVALAVGSVITFGGPPPSPQEWPPAPTTTTTVGTPSVPPTSGGAPTGAPIPGVPNGPTGQQPTVVPPGPGVSTTRGNPVPSSAPGEPGTRSPGAPQLSEFRAPAGHHVAWEANVMTMIFSRDNLPTDNVGAYYGTASDNLDSGGRPAYGGHVLWQDGGRYGYLYVLHRTAGDVPVTEFGLPIVPCANPSAPIAGETCETVTLTDSVGGTEVRFDINRGGYHLRGMTRHRPDTNGGKDIDVTIGFYLPEPGGTWPQFPNLAGKPPLAEIPYSAAQLSSFLNT